MSVPPVIAHRGWATRYPENSLPALSAAVAAGVRLVEFDVQLSADGVPLVIHDPTLERTAGRPECVMDLPWERLAGVTLRHDGADGAIATAPLSSLAEAARWLAETPDVTAFVELKRHSAERFGPEAFVEACLGALGPVADRCVITTFEVPIIEAARARGTGRVAWVCRTYDPPSLETAFRLAPDYLFCNHEKLPADETRLPAGGWSWVFYEVRTAALARALFDRGARYVETMAVGELLAALGSETRST